MPAKGSLDCCATYCGKIKSIGMPGFKVGECSLTAAKACRVTAINKRLIGLLKHNTFCATLELIVTSKPGKGK
eukprot:10709306-Ditylum_brightwellii.AAC.1